MALSRHARRWPPDHAGSLRQVAAQPVRYTCGIGVAAGSGRRGASIVNVDFAESNLTVGRRTLVATTCRSACASSHSDAFAAMRQFAGIGQPAVVRASMPAFPRLDQRRFDLVFVDPPRYAKSPFGVVDIVNDYAALMKLALRY